MAVTLRYKILFGYIILMIVIGSMAAILIYERRRMREIEAETANINLVRRDINTAHRRITGLATLGEGVVNWNKADYLYYRNRRLQADSLLNSLKRHCREYVRPEQIDTLRALLAEKGAGKPVAGSGEACNTYPYHRTKEKRDCRILRKKRRNTSNAIPKRTS